VSKVGERIIQLILCSLILLSLYFSINIWANPSKKDYSETENATAAIATSSPSDVFTPVQLVRHINGHTKWMRGENLISSVQSIVNQANFADLDEVANNPSDYKREIDSIKNGIELLYQDEYLLSEYIDSFNLDLEQPSGKDGKDFAFSSAYIDFDTNKIYLADADTHTVFAGKITVNIPAINDRLAAKDVSSTAVTIGHKVMPYEYYVETPVQMKKYSYILASQPFTSFRDAFFTNPNDVSTNEESKDLIYSGGNNEIMMIEEATGALLYRGPLATDAEMKENIYSQSFHYVKKLGNIFNGIRYFDTNGNTVTYRTFVEGFPLFSKVDKGKIEVSISNASSTDKRVNISTSVDTIQVPIPADETVTMPTTADIVKQLLAAGADGKKIDSAVIGYSWNMLQDVKQVVDLTPQWYVEYDEQWMPLASCITLVSQKGGN
jgi:regulatory protein YycH of two-component signal transduction system YycFG